MMDGAYIVGRNGILAWRNTMLQLGLSKVEKVSSARLSPSSLSVLFTLMVEPRFRESLGRMRAKRLGYVRVSSP